MASSSSSSKFLPPRPPRRPSPLSPASLTECDDIPYTPTPLKITREEFKTFHKIDRTLFSHLVFVIGLDINQSLHIMAFLLWLEHCGEARKLVAFVISSPESFIDAFVDEVSLCLDCMSNDDFALFAANFGNDGAYKDAIPLMRRLTKSQLTLRYVHENREIIHHGIQKNMEVCIGAFDDICENADRIVFHEKKKKKKKTDEERMKMEEKMNRLTIGWGFHGGQGESSQAAARQDHLTIGRAVRVPVAFHGGQGESSQAAARQDHFRAPVTFHGSQSESVQTAALRQVLSSDPIRSVTDAPNVMVYGGGSSGGGNGGGQEEEVPADDRTIFLTFSKGYPISQSEVINFFTKRFGNVIEAVYMQEVDENEQPLYARMVLHSPASMSVMLNSRLKNKFTINGKHVWARKYVRKTPRVG